MSRRQFNQVRSCFVRISVILTVRLSYVLLDNVEKKKYRKLVKKKKRRNAWKYNDIDERVSIV